MKSLPVNCKLCGTLFQKPISEIKRMDKLGYKNHFCSNDCSCRYNKNQNKVVCPILRREKYYKHPKKCLLCNFIIPYEKQWGNRKYCSSKCASIHTQINGGHCHWSEEDKKRISEASKKNQPKAKRMCVYCKKEFESPPSSKQICCSKKCAGEWTKKTGSMKGKTGGYRIKGGRGKQGWYKGYYCSSSWELAWVIYNLEHGIDFERNKEGFPYEFDNIKHKFYPDFILKSSGDYVEIKAFIDKKNAAKISFFPYTLNVIGRYDIKPFIDYTVQKYGVDYTRLYEPRKIY